MSAETTGTAMPSALDVVRAVYVSHEHRDTPGLVDLLTDDVEWHQAEGHPYYGGRPWRGPDEVVENVVEHINSDWDDYQTSVEEFIDAGDSVVVLGRYSGTYRSTGRQIDVPVCTIYRVRNGQIWHWQQFTNTAAFRHAMQLPYQPETS
jgi:ketosteroid isomerase-like protein